MSRFYVPPESVRGNKIYISGREAHHILDVLRLKKLDKIVAFDGTGKEYIGFIKEVKPKALVVEVVQTRLPVSREKAKVTLIQAIPKKERMDYIVEKSTELGASAVIPIITKRTIVRWDSKKSSSHVERWRRIAREASKQCGRPDVPRIYDVMDFDEAIKTSSDYDLALMATVSDDAGRLNETLAEFNGGKVSILIGPEGDFTPDEVKSARGANFKVVSLGPRILRSDTAGIAMLAILNYEFSK